MAKRINPNSIAPKACASKKVGSGLGLKGVAAVVAMTAVGFYAANYQEPMDYAQSCADQTIECALASNALDVTAQLYYSDPSMSLSSELDVSSKRTVEEVIADDYQRILDYGEFAYKQAQDDGLSVAESRVEAEEAMLDEANYLWKDRIESIHIESLSTAVRAQHITAVKNEIMAFISDNNYSPYQIAGPGALQTAMNLSQDGFGKEVMESMGGIQKFALAIDIAGLDKYSLKDILKRHDYSDKLIATDPGSYLDKLNDNEIALSAKQACVFVDSAMEGKKAQCESSLTR